MYHKMSKFLRHNDTHAVTVAKTQYLDMSFQNSYDKYERMPHSKTSVYENVC